MSSVWGYKKIATVHDLARNETWLKKNVVRETPLNSVTTKTQINYVKIPDSEPGDITSSFRMNCHHLYCHAKMGLSFDPHLPQWRYGYNSTRTSHNHFHLTINNFPRWCSILSSVFGKGQFYCAIPDYRALNMVGINDHARSQLSFSCETGWYP